MATWLAKKTPFAHLFYQKWGSIASLAKADPNIIGSGWLGPVINVFLQYILWGLVSYGLPMPLYAKLTPQNDSQVYIWPSGHRSKLWCFPVMELWAYHRDTSVRYNLPLTIGNLVK